MPKNHCSVSSKKVRAPGVPGLVRIESQTTVSSSGRPGTGAVAAAPALTCRDAASTWTDDIPARRSTRRTRAGSLRTGSMARGLQLWE
ncbi:hypothetical protein GCM10009811_13090 [Nostocoides veronense]|uniref:Uncharacterized protein n=1 Tax=Nostocoides veronense TaxID=330836 RepID=A0ABP4XRR9_9MICO